jgi:hypothetical protein
VIAGAHLALHDRAGNPEQLIEIADLGVSALRGPFHWSADDEFLAVGRLATGDETERLVRCTLLTPACSALPLAAGGIADIVRHPMDDTLFYLDTQAGTLVHADGSGEVLASAPLDLPPEPRLYLQSGLMFVNSANAPAINVLRYDANAFGKQLDQVLLLPPGAISQQQSEATDFTPVADGWWVTLRNPETGSTGVYGFDRQWSDLGEITIEVPPATRGLTGWGNRLLINTGDALHLQRFNQAGQPETLFEPGQLIDLADAAAAASTRQAAVFRWCVIGSALLALAALLSAWHQRARALVYSVQRERGAPPAEESADAARWLAPEAGRSARFTAIATACGLLSLGCIGVAMLQGIAPWAMTALVIALVGPLLAIVIVKRAPIGHIGTRDGLLMLVDHRGIYHQGIGSQVTYRDSFLLLDDVVVFCGNRLLPAFDTRQFAEIAKAHVRGGVRVDRKTLWVKLIESGHPLARAVLAIVACGALALATGLGGA